MSLRPPFSPSVIARREVGEVFVSVDIRKTQARSPDRGKVAGRTQVALRYLLLVVYHCLYETVFQVGGLVLRQTVGSCIGSPLSGALCLMVVMHREFYFFQSLAAVSEDLPLLGLLRYADNRLVLGCGSSSWSSISVEVAHKDFYGSPIELEPEPQSSFNGQVVVPFLGTTFYMGMSGIHRDRPFISAVRTTHGAREVISGDLQQWQGREWRYRSAQSASGSHVLVAVIATRIITAVRLSLPSPMASVAFVEVILVQVQKGIPYYAIRQAILVAFRCRVTRRAVGKQLVQDILAIASKSKQVAISILPSPVIISRAKLHVPTHACAMRE